MTTDNLDNLPGSIVFSARASTNKEQLVAGKADKAPRVQMGSGATPSKVVKHIPKVQMGSGAAPAKVSRHLPTT